MSRSETRPGAARQVYEFLAGPAVLTVVLVLALTFLGRVVVVDGVSMEPTLYHGEILLVRSAACDPQPGDVVILAKEGFHDGEVIVKRVIAAGGQRVDIDYAAGTVSVDGTVLEEPYLNLAEAMAQQYGHTVTGLTVPEGSVFVMGDNRNSSDDSRNPLLGAVDTRLVIGEAVLVVFPFSQFQVL